MLRRTLSIASLLALGTPALAQTPDQPPPPPPDQTQPPTPPAPPPTPPTPPPTTTVVVVPPAEPPKEAPKKDEGLPVHNKYDVSLYGFVEFDAIHDTTQGLGDLAGNSTIARPNTYTGDHGQTMFGARNSRIGIKVGAPKYNDVKATAQLEMDFLGNQAGTPLSSTALVSEQAFWQNPTFRFRHMNVKLETKALDILIGQYWQLFGWQTMSHPNTVQIQGVAGQVYSRSPQIRLSKKIKAGDSASVEVAIAASRPPQRASSAPDGQAGIKLNIDALKAWHTAGSTGSSLDSAAIGVSVVGRRFAVDDFSASPGKQVTTNGYGLSVDALLPIVPAKSKEHHGGALTFTGSFVTGAGIADLYQSLNGGVGNPALPNPGMATPAPTYAPNIDGGMVQWFADAAAASGYSLHPIQWTSELAGLQYYLPPSGKVWLSANYAHMSSGNAADYGAANKIWNSEDWADGNLMFDITPAVRMGAEFSWTAQKFVDATTATDYRGQFSAFFLF